MNFINELRSNYRLRIGLTLIAGIVWLSMLFDLHDKNNASLDQYRQTASQLARFNVQQKQTQWITRAHDAVDALTGAEARLWQNPTLGLTQAEMRDWLLRQLLRAKAAQYTVKVSESGADKVEQKSDKTGDSGSDLVRVRAAIEFNTDPTALNSFLSELAVAEHEIAVESITVKQPRTVMTVVSWYKLQPAMPATNVSRPDAAR
jgi:hypothetical protein